MAEMTELEKLRKHMTYFRAFARNVRSMVRLAGTIRCEKRLEAIQGEIRLMESQWPDWLLDGIEGMSEEELVAEGLKKRVE